MKETIAKKPASLTAALENKDKTQGYLQFVAYMLAVNQAVDEQVVIKKTEVIQAQTADLDRQVTKRNIYNIPEGYELPELSEDDLEDVQIQLWMSELELNIIKAKFKAELEQDAPDQEKLRKLYAAMLRLEQVYASKKKANRWGEFFSVLYGVAQGGMVAGFFIMLVGFATATGAPLTAGISLGAAGFFFLLSGITNYFLIRKDMPQLLLDSPFYNRSKRIEWKKKWNEFKANPLEGFKKVFFNKAAITGLAGALLIGTFSVLGNISFMKAISESYHIPYVVVIAVPWILTFLMIFIPELALNTNSNRKFFAGGVEINYQPKIGFSLKGIRAFLGLITGLGYLDAYIDAKIEQFFNAERVGSIPKPAGEDNNQNAVDKLKSKYKRDFYICMVGMLATGYVALGELATLIPGALGNSWAFSFVILTLGTLCTLPFYFCRAETGVKHEIARLRGEGETLKPWFNVTRNVNAVGQAFPAIIAMLAIAGIFVSGVSFIDGFDLVPDIGTIAGSSEGYIFGAILVGIFAIGVGLCARHASRLGSSEGDQDMWQVASLESKVNTQLKKITDKPALDLQADAMASSASCTGSLCVKSYAAEEKALGSNWGYNFGPSSLSEDLNAAGIVVGAKKAL